MPLDSPAPASVGSHSTSRITMRDGVTTTLRATIIVLPNTVVLLSLLLVGLLIELREVRGMPTTS